MTVLTLRIFSLLCQRDSLLSSGKVPHGTSLCTQAPNPTPATAQVFAILTHQGHGEGTDYVFFITCVLITFEASLVAQQVKNLPAMQETWVRSLVGKIPWRRERLPTPVFWPGEFHRLFPWGRKESDMTERLFSLITFKFSSVLGLFHTTAYPTSFHPGSSSHPSTLKARCIS